MSRYARDDVPSLGLGIARARLQPPPRHREEPAQPCSVPRRGRVGSARTRARRRRGGMAGGRRDEPVAGAHRMRPQRSAQSMLARYRRGRHQPSRFENRPATVLSLGAAARAHVAALPVAPDPDTFPYPRHAEGRGRTASRPAGARSAQTRSSADYACMTCAIPPQLRRLRRAKVYRSSAGSSGITGIAPRRAKHTLTTPIWLRRRRGSASSSQKQYVPPGIARSPDSDRMGCGILLTARIRSRIRRN